MIQLHPDELIVDRDSSGRFLPGNSASPETQFRPGERRSPKTEFKPGERRSPATEFRPGQPAPNRLPVGTVRVRIETSTGLPRAWLKIAEPSIWQKRAAIVWESLNGPLPRGYVIHHKDRDSLNDSPDNLVALTRKAHAYEHRFELLAARIS